MLLLQHNWTKLRLNENITFYAQMQIEKLRAMKSNFLRYTRTNNAVGNIILISYDNREAFSQQVYDCDIS